MRGITLYPDWKRRALFCAALFLIVFNPPVLKRLSFTMVFSLLAVADLALHYGETCAMLRELRKPFRILLIAACYYFVLCAVLSLIDMDNAGRYFYYFADIFVMFVCQIALPLSIIRIARRCGYGPKDLGSFFLWMALAQGFLAVLCVVSPSIKYTLNETMSLNASSEDFGVVIWVNSYRRNYGFASTLFDIFGFTMSILSVMAFCRAYCTRSKIWYGFFAVSALTAFLNARTGIVLIGAGVVLCVLLANGRRLSGMDLAKKGLLAAALIVVSIFALRKLGSSESATASWMSSGIGEILALFRGEKTGIFATMSNQFIFFPENVWQTIFGTGWTTVEAAGRSTDMGYIQSLWRYGIIGSVLNYGFWISLCVNAYRNRKDEEDRMLVICLAALLFIYQIKLNTWGYSMAGTVFYPVLMYIALGKRKTETEELACE